MNTVEELERAIEQLPVEEKLARWMGERLAVIAPESGRSLSVFETIAPS